MGRITDDIFLGTAFGPNATGDGNPAYMESGVGPAGRVFIFDILPLTLQVAGLAASQNPISGASFALTAGTGVTSRTRSDSVVEYVLDVPRCVTITAAGANTATYTVTGYDFYGQRMTQLLAAPSTSTVATTKAFKTIISVTNANATAGTNGITVGFNDKFGLLISVTNTAYIIHVKWNNVLADDAGTLVLADTTSPATASTTDVRGCYTPTSAANGSRRLVLSIALTAAAAGPASTRVGAFGVTQV